MATFLSLFTSLLSLTTLSVANPIIKIRNNGITVNFATRINVTGTSQLVKAEQARAQAFLQRITSKAPPVFKPDAAVTNIPVTNAAVLYTIKVSVGKPSTDYTLVIDTGSSNTWIGAHKKYTPTKSSKDTHDTVSASYGSGGFRGKEVIDVVDLGRGLVIPNQSIGVANESVGFGEGIDGILGLGPVDLTATTLSSKKEIPTVMDNLAKAGTISTNSVGVFFAPTTSPSDTNGQLTFGGIDSSKITGDVTFVPVTSTFPASKFWGINQTITYGNHGPIILKGAGIIDTGSSLILIATDAFQIYVKTVGATPDRATGLLKITDDCKLESLFYKIGDTTFEFTAEAQKWPKKLNTLIGGEANTTYLVVADMGQPSGQGLDFINGYAWVERFYTIYDTDKKRVGFANTPRTKHSK